MKHQEVNAIVTKKTKVRKMEERKEIRRRRPGFERCKGHTAVYTTVFTVTIVECRTIFYVGG